MDTMTLTTPALLFPAISLLLLAYTNRFLALANVIRTLHAQYKVRPEKIILKQIHNLRRRVILIRNMQALGVFSFFLSVFCMFLLFNGYDVYAKYIFGIGLFCLMLSLLISLWEINISVKALNYHLSDIESDQF